LALFCLHKLLSAPLRHEKLLAILSTTLSVYASLRLSKACTNEISKVQALFTITPRAMRPRISIKAYEQPLRSAVHFLFLTIYQSPLSVSERVASTAILPLVHFSPPAVPPTLAPTVDSPSPPALPHPPPGSFCAVPPPPVSPSAIPPPSTWSLTLRAPISVARHPSPPWLEASIARDAVGLRDADEGRTQGPQREGLQG
jgi:hypothetical protein